MIGALVHVHVGCRLLEHVCAPLILVELALRVVALALRLHAALVSLAGTWLTHGSLSAQAPCLALLPILLLLDFLLFFIHFVVEVLIVIVSIEKFFEFFLIQ